MGRPVDLLNQTPNPSVIALDQALATDRIIEIQDWLRDQANCLAAMDYSGERVRICFEDRAKAALFRLFFDEDGSVEEIRQ